MRVSKISYYLLKICVFHNKCYIKRKEKKEDTSLCEKFHFRSLQTKTDYLTNNTGTPG